MFRSVHFDSLFIKDNISPAPVFHNLTHIFNHTHLRKMIKIKNMVKIKKIVATGADRAFKITWAKYKG